MYFNVTWIGRFGSMHVEPCIWFLGSKNEGGGLGH